MMDVAAMMTPGFGYFQQSGGCANQSHARREKIAALTLRNHPSLVIYHGIPLLGPPWFPEALSRKHFLLREWHSERSGLFNLLAHTKRQCR
jgi:hypothetical protein